jgi:hypothetical protein
MTLLADNLIADFLAIEGLVSVTYTARRTDAAGDALDAARNLDNCYIRDLQIPQSPLGDPAQQGDMQSITILKQEFDAAGIAPREGDTVTDPDGVVWTVRSARRQRLGTAYQLRVQEGVV